MPTFTYATRDPATEKVTKATIAAQSEKEAMRMLLARDIVPFTIKKVSAGDSALSLLSGRITGKDKVIFTRQLATLINAGLPLSQALTTVEEQTANKKLKAIIRDIMTSVEGGTTMADSFAKYPKVFNQVFVALVAAGEASGTLDKSLERLADQQEKDADMASKIRGALAYPIIVLVVIMAVIIFMLITVVPQVETLYQDMHKSLPFLTLIMVSVANFITDFWWLLLIILIGIVFLLSRYVKTTSGRKTFDLLKLNVPMFKQIFRKMYMARFTRTMETLLSAGVQMLEALKIASLAVNNVVVKDEIIAARGRVKGGKSLSAALKGEQYILTFVPQMIRIGEKSGQIDTMLAKTAKYYEDEVDAAIKTISTAIEPILMIALAGVAALIVGAVLVPIYGLASTTAL